MSKRRQQIREMDEMTRRIRKMEDDFKELSDSMVKFATVVGAKIVEQNSVINHLHEALHSMEEAVSGFRTPNLRA